jgi:hypothetical protein
MPFIQETRPYSRDSGFGLELGVAEAGGEVVVDHANGLHEGVADGGADEGEAAGFEGFGHGFGFGGLGGKLVEGVEVVLAGGAAGELPEEVAEGAVLFGQGEVGAGVLHGAVDFEAVADDAGVLQELGDFGVVVAGDFVGIEVVEGGVVGVALAEDGDPTEAGLGAVEDELGEELAVVVFGDAPFVVVVGEVEGVGAGPGAAGLGGHEGGV